MGNIEETPFKASNNLCINYRHDAKASLFAQAGDAFETRLY